MKTWETEIEAWQDNSVLLGNEVLNIEYEGVDDLPFSISDMQVIAKTIKKQGIKKFTLSFAECYAAEIEEDVIPILEQEGYHKSGNTSVQVDWGTHIEECSAIMLEQEIMSPLYKKWIPYKYAPYTSDMVKDDGYYIYAKDGYIFGSTQNGVIHENSVRAALRELAKGVYSKEDTILANRIA